MSHDSRKCGLELNICERKNANTPTLTEALISYVHPRLAQRSIFILDYNEDFEHIY
jgi:hypothetical protein